VTTLPPTTIPDSYTGRCAEGLVRIVPDMSNQEHFDEKVPPCDAVNPRYGLRCKLPLGHVGAHQANPDSFAVLAWGFEMGAPR